ncbi:hypothetical protein [Consotaella salsifontis]|uniref:Uncharacterized protein n=1 Tax=Consotaella salsifontis TaxID=1365950 RepID=A0A1T4RMN1_9HYPH|nr:hypothetical protein [Consotaella salsifontis]SKA17265.1 hypothetical protein SAMN05428963_107103 [Consotaella salsifontis]
MRYFPAFAVAALAVAIPLSACSQTEERTSVVAAAEAAPAPSPKPASAKIIGLEGLGDLRIGEPVPRGSSWAERGAQTSDKCRTVSSPAYPGVYAIVTDGKVRRISVAKSSDVKLAEGIGVGATEKEVRQWFGGFREEPHNYWSAPAKYLTAPNAKDGSSALRFEIGTDGKVSQIHVGTMPILGYVEGCA